jgi:hypothetical protein
MNRSTLAAGGFPPPGRVLVLLLAGLPLLAGSCREARVAHYRIPKENEATVSSAAAPVPAGVAPGAAGAAVTVAARPAAELSWTAPAAWKARTASSMRRGSYEVGEGSGPRADLAITVFPGDVGGDLANVNRWRGQINLPPIAETDLAAALQVVTAPNGLSIRYVDLTGGTADNPLRLLSAIVPHAGSTWFFKLTGPAAIVGAEKARFVEFLATITPGASPAATVATPAGAPAPTASVPPPPDALAASAAIPNLRWEAPAHWQAKPATALRKGTYTLPDASGASAELAITAFPGAVGGELANLNRWRAQLQLPPIGEAALGGAVTRLTVHGLPVAVVEFAGGPGGSQRLLGAIVPHDGATWFFKLTGPDALVAAEKPAFLAFLQTLSAP